MIKSLLKLKTMPEYFDASDALAVAVCHSHRITRPRSGFKTWKSFVEAHPERIVERNVK